LSAVQGARETAGCDSSKECTPPWGTGSHWQQGCGGGMGGEPRSARDLVLYRVQKPRADGRNDASNDSIERLPEHTRMGYRGYMCTLTGRKCAIEGPV